MFEGWNPLRKASAAGAGAIALVLMGAVGSQYVSRSHGTSSVRAESLSSLDQSHRTSRSRSGSSRQPKTRPALGSISLNEATEQELDALPGVGPTTARRIVEYRTEHGGFKSIDELDNVKGIGPKKLELIRPYCRL